MRHWGRFRGEGFEAPYTGAHGGTKHTRIVSLMSPGSHVVKAPTITKISLLAWDGNNFSSFVATSKEFCKEGSPPTTVCCNVCTSYKIDEETVKETVDSMRDTLAHGEANDWVRKVRKINYLDVLLWVASQITNFFSPLISSYNYTQLTYRILIEEFLDKIFEKLEHQWTRVTIYTHCGRTPTGIK